MEDTMKNLLVTDEEKAFILKRRELAAKRKKLRHAQPQHPVQQHAQQPQQQNNRPAGWDDHNEPDRVHKGRITEGHPMFWFEKDIFSKIGNVAHKEQHKLIRKLLGMPVQNLFRDRVYHAITHLDALWEQCMLPLKYKKKYEDFKVLHNIGDDNVHPEHKKEKPDFDYPIAQKNRPWNPEAYGAPDESEVYQNGKKFRYDYDEECGYEYKSA
jgi:hypothetical protein